MGGRGASSGLAKGDKKYGTEYKTLLSTSNIKFVQRNNNSAAAPLETMTKGRVYVTVSEINELKHISYYDVENKRVKTIDLDHTHKGIKPHVHHGYNHNEKDVEKGATKLNKKEKKMVDKVIQIWYNNNRQVVM